MKAWTFTSRGPPSDVLTLQRDFPQPQPSDLQQDEVLIKVSHVSLYAPMMQLMAVMPHLNSNPWIPEHEFSGTITATGGVTAASQRAALQNGDEVFGMVNPKKMKYNGALAEYIIVPLESVAKKPPNITMAEAACLGGGGCTVIGFAERTGMIEIRQTQEGPVICNKAIGKRVLVTGGSTRIGQFMLSLAKTLVGVDGSVVTTASPRNEKLVRELGADQVIDYTRPPSLSAHLQQHNSTPSTQFDVIFDISGSDPDLFARSPSYLREDGVFVFGGNMTRSHVAPGPGIFGAVGWILRLASVVLSWQLNAVWPVVFGGVPRHCFFHSGTPSRRDLELVRGLVEDGKVKAVVDSVWKFDNVLEAYKFLANERISGKVVIDVQG